MYMLQSVQQVQSVTSTNMNAMFVLGIMGGGAVVFGGVEVFYNLLDTLQLLSYLQYLNVQLPYNLSTYFNLFKFAQLSFIASYFNVKSIISNYVDQSKLKPVPQKIADDNFTFLFIFNGSLVFVIWATLLGIYVVTVIALKILNLYKPKFMQDVLGQSDFLTKFRLYYLSILHSFFLICFKPIQKTIESYKQISGEVSMSLTLIMTTMLANDSDIQQLVYEGRENIGWCCTTVISFILVVQIFLDGIQQWKLLFSKFKFLKEIFGKLRYIFSPQVDVLPRTTPNIFEA